MKSEVNVTNLSHFHEADSLYLDLPKNRALLLDFLQSECQRFNFRRETYYLSQSYLDSFLQKEKESVRISRL